MGKASSSLLDGVGEYSEYPDISYWSKGGIGWRVSWLI